MFTVVFRTDYFIPSYLKQLSLFCLLRLIGTSADPTGYITNFCSMMELLDELKKSSC